MAHKDELAKELATQVQSLKTWYDELSDDITKITTTIREFAAKRVELLNEYVARILPDLSGPVLERASRRFLVIIDPAIIQTLLENDRRVIQEQLAAVREADTSKQELNLRRELQREADILDSVDAAYRETVSIGGLHTLIRTAPTKSSASFIWTTGVRCARCSTHAPRFVTMLDARCSKSTTN